jgi:hypothetical protein
MYDPLTERRSCVQQQQRSNELLLNCEIVAVGLASRNVP